MMNINLFHLGTKISLISNQSFPESSETAALSMSRVDKLHHTAQLKRTGFGQPPPRHGLHLLHWFCTECLCFDENNKMVAYCNPNEGDFGFHRFENRFENGVQLLPDINVPYYVVGNLNTDGANELPDYVHKMYTGLYDNSNKDRIIVSLKNGRFDKVYITEHFGEWNYDPDKTYRINNKLIKYISHKNRTDFLNEMGIRSTINVTPENRPNIETRPAPQRHETHITINNNTEQNSPRSRGLWDYCTIL